MLRTSPYLLAEIANAHSGNFDTLMDLIGVAGRTGAHGVKFQWFRPETLAMPDFEWFSVYEKLMFSEKQWDEAIRKAVSEKLDIWVDATDQSSIARIERHEAEIYGLKLPPSTILETEHALQVLAFQKPTLVGVGGHEDDVIDKCVQRFLSTSDRIILQHGFQAYPTRPEDASLARLQHLSTRHGLPVAYADHEMGGSPLAEKLPQFAYFAGAILLEKHICIDRSTQPYDYYSSMEELEFTSFVKEMSVCASILGGTEITEAQKKYLSVASRAILTSAKKAGDAILPEDVIFRRTPKTEALTPDLLETVMPAIACADLPALHPILDADISKLKVVAVVPCRLHSTRLPAKALLPIEGVPSIQRCLINVKQIRFVDKVVLATSTNSQDDPLVGAAGEIGVSTYRGSEDDVLERILSIGEQEQPDILLRLTGDCPALSFEMMEYMIIEHVRSGADLTYCHDNVAVGSVGDVYKYSALLRLRKRVATTPYSEYLSYYFINNPDLFKTLHISLPARWTRPEWRTTLDEQVDLDLLGAMYAFHGIRNAPISFRQVEEFFFAHPELSGAGHSAKVKYKSDPEFIRKLNEATILRH